MIRLEKDKDAGIWHVTGSEHEDSILCTLFMIEHYKSLLVDVMSHLSDRIDSLSKSEEGLVLRCMDIISMQNAIDKLTISATHEQVDWANKNLESALTKVEED